jgi:uncharacterized membrane protein (DUF485 family)
MYVGPILDSAGHLVAHEPNYLGTCVHCIVTYPFAVLSFILLFFLTMSFFGTGVLERQRHAV